MDSSFSNDGYDTDLDVSMDVELDDAMLDPYGADPQPSAEDIVRATAAAAAATAIQARPVDARQPWQHPYRRDLTY